MNASLHAATVTPTAMSSFALATHNSTVSAVGMGGPGASLTSTALSISNKLNLSLGTGLGMSKSPKRPARYRRLPSTSPKKSPNPAAAAAAAAAAASTTMTTPTTAQSITALASADPALPFERIPDSFRVYRANNQRDVSESDDAPSQSSSPCSSCSDFSMTGSCSDFDSDEASDGDAHSEDGDSDSTKAHAMRDDSQEECTTDAMDLQHASLNNAQGNGNMAISSSDSSSDSDDDDDDEEEDDDEEDEEEQQQLQLDAKNARVTRSTPTPLQGRGGAMAAARGRGKRRNNLSESTSSTATPPPLLRKAGKLRSATPNASPLVNSIKARRSTTTATTLTNNNKASKLHHELEETATEVHVRHNHSNQKAALEPLQLVWAKCRGYPWYPALILDPKTPKGFVYNGVPLPAPPTDVLALRKNCLDDVVFLVLFFDVKRTWQWLPANKLDILGIDKQLDQQKLVESRKPAERKAVKKAYQDALHYQSQVSDLEGQGPDPIM